MCSYTVYTYCYMSVCIYTDCFAKYVPNLRMVLYGSFKWKKCSYHHHMPVYQPLHRYEHFNVSLYRTVRCQLPVIHLHEYSHLWHRPLPRTPIFPSYKYDSQFSFTACLAHGCAAVFESFSVAVFVSWRSLGQMQSIQICHFAYGYCNGRAWAADELSMVSESKDSKHTRWYLWRSLHLSAKLKSSNTLCCAGKHTACCIRKTSRQTSACIKSVAYFTSYWPLPYHI